MLEFAEKYNWWTPLKMKKNLSKQAKIEYILSYGTVDELKKMVKEVGGKEVFQVWEKIKSPLKGRQAVVKYFVTAHKND